MNGSLQNSSDPAVNAVFDLQPESEKRIKFNKKKILILVLCTVAIAVISACLLCANTSANLLKSDQARPDCPKPIKSVESKTEIQVKDIENTKWLSFVDSVYTRLSQHDIQKNRSKFIEDLGFSQRISFENLDRFVEAIEKYKVVNNLNGFVPNNGHQLELLNDALDLTLKHKTDYSCEGNTLSLNGSFVMLRELKKINCSNTFTRIFSLSKVFIDDDLIWIGRKTKLAIASPFIEIIGNRKVDLSGKIANSLDPESYGKPGNPGGSSGSFLAIGKEFVGNHGNLVILTNGGRGGDGGRDEKEIKDEPQITGCGHSYFFPCSYLQTICGKGGYGGEKGLVDILLENDLEVKIQNEGWVDILFKNDIKVKILNENGSLGQNGLFENR